MSNRFLSLMLGSKTLGVCLVVALISLGILSGCGLFSDGPSEKVKSYAVNFEIVGAEKEEIVGEVSNSIFLTAERSNLVAEEYHISGVGKEGIEFSVPEGRYEITGRVTGNVYIYDEAGDLVYHNILGSQFGVRSITLDMLETHVGFVDGGFDDVLLTPVSTEMSTELTGGLWKVGVDIEPGEYSFMGAARNGGYGFVEIFDPSEEVRVFEVISGEFSYTKSWVELKEGQMIRITGISTVHFEEVE